MASLSLLKEAQQPHKWFDVRADEGVRLVASASRQPPRPHIVEERWSRYGLLYGERECMAERS